MIAIAVDDEPLMLRALVSAVSSSPDISEVVQFSDCKKALEYIKENVVNIAFLDVNMRGMGGLALAEKIIFYRPNCKIVFCTGYEEYAVPAFKPIKRYRSKSSELFSPTKLKSVLPVLKRISFKIYCI